MRSYLIFGAGAVGSTLGAYLARAGHPVHLVSRESHAAAIRAAGGLSTVSYDETFLAPVRASSDLPGSVPDDAVLFSTVQSPEARAAARTLSALAATRPMVAWQNGIRGEEDAMAFAPRLYGGIVRFTSTLLEPGEVRLRRPGQLIVGRYPRGADTVSAGIVNDLKVAGFTAAESPGIMTEKALKLLVNLVSGPAVLVRRTGPCPELSQVQVALLEEARAAYAAAGIPAEPLSGLGQPLDSMIEQFRSGGSAPDGRAVYNSTWQNLHHARPRIENAYYHGEILRLCREHGLPCAVNERALALLEEVRAKGLGPEPFTPEAFRERFADVVDFDTPSAAAAPPGSAASLEI